MKIRCINDVHDANKQKCKARWHTISSTICHRIGDHNHTPNPSISGVPQYRSEICEPPKTTMVTHSIVAIASTTALSQFLPTNSLKRTVCRQRAANLKFPGNPRSLSEIRITDSFTLTKEKRAISTI